MMTLARAWIAVSKNRATRTDQKASRFNSTMFEKFKIPVSHWSDNNYGARTPTSVGPKFDELSANSQKLRDALRRVVASKPFGVTEEIVTSTAISIHTGKFYVINYSFRKYCHEV